MTNIVDFYESKGFGINLVGGKGLNLSIMVSSGIDVPPGFILLSTLYEEFISENKIDHIIKSKIEEMDEEDYDNIENGLNDIKNSIINSKFPYSIELEIKKMFEKFEAPVHLAVRSSATAEDLEDASFAGQQETFLNVTSFENLLYSIKCCFASLWGRRAFEYRKAKKFDQKEVSIAVVVQKMVNSEVSGVMFTSNPISGKEEIIIDASYGLGEAIVSGQVTPDNYTLDVEGNIQNCKLGSKNIKIIYSENGIKKVNTTEGDRNRRCLTDIDLKKLSDQAKKIKDLYGVPMDIEWAKEKGKMYILQARKITTLNKDHDNVEKYTYNFGKKEKKYLNNMIEHFPRLWYPLDDEVAMILQNMKYDLFNDVGIYINNPLNMNSLGVIDVENIKLKIGIKILKYPFVYKEYTNNKENIKRGIQELNEIEKEVNCIEECLSVKDTKIEIIDKIINRLICLHKKVSYVRFRYLLFPSVILGGKLDKMLKKIDKNYSEYDLLTNLDYITVSMNKDIDKLSKKFKMNKKLIKEIEKGISIDQIKMFYSEEYNALNEFTKKYGWKSNYCCIPFSSESWNENNNRLLELILLSDSSFDDGDRLSKYDTIVDSIKKKYGINYYKKIIERIEFYRKYHVLRESSQYLWETIFGLLRLSVKNICLKLNMKYEDILYLKIDELKNLIKHNDTLDEYICIINKRKSKRLYAENKWDNMIISIFSYDSDNKFIGVSGSMGKVKGNVCIVRNHSEFKKIKEGDVLVCPYTDPEWTPLFKIAKAVVSDTGGALSHAAIVAREFNIPSVLGVGNATMELKDGDIIIVDGDKGIVEKIV